MLITTGFVDVPAEGTPMRSFLARPRAEGRYPAVVFLSDIFQLTGPMLRISARLAGYGFVVLAPEIYRRIEPPGSAIPFDDAGRARGLEDAGKTPVAHFDADCRSALDFLAAHPAVAPGHLAAAGFCLGGHLAFRAAFQPEVKATTCFYGTGIHDGRLGRDPDAGSLARVAEIRGKLLMIFGSSDPHVPESGRTTIDAALRAAGVNYAIQLYPAEHAFMRDEGPRYDPEQTDRGFGAMVNLFRDVFSTGR